MSDLVNLLERYNIKRYIITNDHAGNHTTGSLLKLYVNRFIHDPREFIKLGYLPIRDLNL